MFVWLVAGCYGLMYGCVLHIGNMENVREVWLVGGCYGLMYGCVLHIGNMENVREDWEQT